MQFNIIKSDFMIKKLKLYTLIYLLISLAIILIITAIVGPIYWNKSIFDVLPTIAGLISGIIALTIPFQMTKIKKEEERMEKRKILERIIQIFNEFLEYNKDSNKNQISIFSGIDYIKLNNKLLHYINTSLRTNSTEGRTAGNIPPREIYDIIINDILTIRITIIATLKGENFYQIEKIEFYDYNKNEIIRKQEDGIKIFKNIPLKAFLNKT